MLGLSTSILKGVTTLRSYIKDGLKLYMPYRGGHSDEVQFVGTGSTYFDGGDYINCGTAIGTVLGDSYDGGISISLWLNYSSGTGIFYIGSGSATGEIEIQMSSAELRFRTATDTYSLKAALTANVWHHIVAIFDGANNMQYLYVDGTLADSDAQAATLDLDGLSTNIGRHYDSSFVYITGSIKNVAIWNRALTATEVQNVMYKTYDEVGGRLASGLVSWWALDATDLGSEILTTTEGDWTAADYWTYSGGTWTYGDNGERDLRFNATALVSGQTYQLSIAIDDTGQISIRDSGGTTYHSAAIYSAGTHNFSFTSDGTDELVIRANDSGSNEFSMTSYSLKKLAPEDRKGSNDGLTYGATVDTDLYGGDTPVKPRAIDNAPTVQADAIGAGSASFSGSAEYIDCGTAIGTAFGGSYDGAITVSVWFKVTTIDSDQGIVCFEDEEFTISIGHEGAGSLNNMAHGTGTLFIDFVDSDSWHYAVATWDGSVDEKKLYLDGVLKGSTSDANPLDLNGKFLLIGSTAKSSGDDFNGNIAQVGLWSKALTQAQVQSVMEKTYDELNADDRTSLVSYWPLDVDGTDSHGDNDGTLE